MGTVINIVWPNASDFVSSLLYMVCSTEKSSCWSNCLTEMQFITADMDPNLHGRKMGVPKLVLTI